MKVLIFLILILATSTLIGQCPEDPNDAILNTQEKYDSFFEKYPYCQDYSVIKYDNKFLGDPDERGYLIVLGGVLIGLLIFLKLVFYFKNS